MTTTPGSLQVVMEVEAATVGDQAPLPSAGSLTIFANQNGKPYTKSSAGAIKSFALANGDVLKPKDIQGRVFVDTENTSGWAGSDFGAWVNAAYAYISSVYTNTNGGIIEIEPGSYSYSTPIVLANAALMTIIMRGAGDGNGSTILNFTKVGRSVSDMVTNGTTTITSATAAFVQADVGCYVSGSADLPQGAWITGVTNGTTATISIAATGSHSAQALTLSPPAVLIGGGSGNDGGVQLEDFTITGTAQGNGAYAVGIGAPGVANVAGASMKNVSIRRFTDGLHWANANSYAMECFNCKVQQCTNGVVPLGEDNVFFGGLIGNNANGIVMSAAGEFNHFGTAFDDNTTTAINISSSLARMTDCGSRYENAGLGTSNYVTISNGSFTKFGGAFQEDNVSGGPATGFVQGTGGFVNLHGVWLYSGGRVLTQAFNVASPCAFSEKDTIIAPGTASPSTTLAQLTPSDYLPAIIATPTGFTTVETLIKRIPIPANSLKVGDTYRIQAFCTIGTSTAGTVTGRVRFGANGTTADAQISSVVTASQTTAQQIVHEILFTVRALGAAGSVIAAMLQTVGAALTNNSTAPAAVAVNTTANNFLEFTLQGGGTAAPTITVTHCTIEKVRSN